MFGIYIHWPYCLKKCPYCNFNSHLATHVDTQLWKRAFLRELSFLHQYTSPLSPSSIFFGGGTPSLMPTSLITDILAHISTLWPYNNIEVSLEANPMMCSGPLFHSLKNAGINRISLGIQSLDNNHLSFLGRQHNRAQSITSLKSALDIFDNVSCDLIYGLPNQTLHQWRHSLQEILHFRPPHISLYQLTIEENTPFYYAVQRKQWQLPCLETQAKFLKMTWQILAENGFDNYEISNFAQPKKACKHNQIYWSYGDYIGVGPGAHGRITHKGVRYQTKGFRHPQTWLKHATETNGLEAFNALTPKETVYEYISMALRIKDGVNWEKLERLGQTSHTKFIDTAKLSHLNALQFIKQNPWGFSLTEKGRMIADTISQEILLT